MFNHFPRLLRATLSALLCWTAACQPPLDSGTEPPETLGAVGTTREIQTARIPRIMAHRARMAGLPHVRRAIAEEIGTLQTSS